MKKPLYLIIALLSLWGSSELKAQDSTTSVNYKRLFAVTGAETAFYVGGMIYLSEIWYRDYERVPFHWYNDNAGYLQMDKMAHAYISYQESKAGYHALRWSGISKNKALIFGGTLGFVLQLPVEIFDGIYEGYGFSPGDVVANAAGSLLFIGQEWAWDEQKIKMKYSFYPSEYAQYRPRFLGESTLEQMFLDYNSHTYWLSANIKSITGWQNVPSWLNLALGYSANGMLGEFKNPTTYEGNPLPEITRYRQLLLSMDVDFTKIPAKRKFFKGLYQGLNLLKVPFPTLEYNKEKGLILRPLYY